MNSLTFPDINVWLALLMADHAHRRAALRWWKEDESESIAFCRITQLGVLRLLTTAAAMNDRPFTMNQAWKAYDRLFEDPRVSFLHEPVGMDDRIRRLAAGSVSSPKLWANGYLAAFASRAGATLITFDQALAATGGGTLLVG